MPKLLIKRGTRAQLNAAASGSALNAGEPYLITDEGRLAVGTAATTYEAAAKESHTHVTGDVSGLGTIATQAANNVSITGGALAGLTSVGTGSLTASGAISGATLAATGLTSGYFPTATTGGSLVDSSIENTGSGPWLRRAGAGNGAGEYWGWATRNATNTDVVAIGETSSAYQPTGALQWLGNSMSYIYFPAEFRLGTGIGATPAITVKSSLNVLIGTTTSTGPKLEVAGDVGLTGFIALSEMTAPAAPAANGARLFVEDNGSGKSRLVVRFASGANQVLATEP